jgi:tannase/feruloyl esterase
MTLINNAVLAQCAGQDSGVKSDGFLTDPRDCRFDPKVLQCSGGNTPPNCLTPNQVSVIQKYYDGPSDPRTHQLINPGNARGSEASTVGALGFILNESLPEPAFDGLFYWVFGPGFGDPTSAHNFQNFDFDHDVAAVDAVLAADLNATSTDLGEFRKHGGKLIMYHGWADPLIPSQSSINYFNAVVAGHNGEENEDEDDDEDRGALRHTQEFFRLFMAPGTYHCGSGPGPNVFGGAFNQGGPDDADHNALSALVEWVEHGIAPERIIATKFVNDVPAQGIAMQRPLCVFPKVAVYAGTGNPADATSFVCKTDERDLNPKPAPIYGP